LSIKDFLDVNLISFTLGSDCNVLITPLFQPALFQRQEIANTRAPVIYAAAGVNFRGVRQETSL